MARHERFRSASRASSVGIEFALFVVLFLMAGVWADERWGTTPWLSLVGLIIGSIGGFRVIWQVAKQAGEDSERDA